MVIVERGCGMIEESEVLVPDIDGIFWGVEVWVIFGEVGKSINLDLSLFCRVW